MNFGEALQAMKEGKQIKRSIWGGHWYLAENIEGSHDGIISCGGSISTVGFEMPEMIIAVLRDGQGVAPAQPYQQDILAEDWQIVE
jgi:hypothetical protein